MNVGTDGRYKKIAVHNGSRFTQPTRMRIYKNGGWVDFGVNDSGNTNSINVIKNGRSVRATLNKDVVTTPVTRYRGYHQGSIGTTTEQRYCFHNTAPGVSNTRFYVYITFVAQGASNLFSFSANGGATTFELKVDSDGKVHYKIHDDMFAHRDWDEPLGYVSMGFGQGWQTVEINSDWSDSTHLGTKVNGANYTVISWHTAWDSKAYGTVGSNNTRIKTDGLNINTANAAHTYVPDDSYTDSVTTVNWI